MAGEPPEPRERTLSESPSTRRMAPLRLRERWLYRKDGGDYGPVPTEDLLSAIERREIGLETQICLLARGRWQTLGETALLRDYYEDCVPKWEAEQLDDEAEAQVRKLVMKRAARRGAWRLMLIGIVVAVGLGSWLVWRLQQAVPLGLVHAVTVASPDVLPGPPVPSVKFDPMVAAPTKSVARLVEYETYDTRGVALEGTVEVPQRARKMSFGEDGTATVAGLGAHGLAQVTNAARDGVYACAKKAARRDRAFTGTRVGFTVDSGALTHITVGAEVKSKPAFMACVKASLKRVAVPEFEGGGRRVSVPIKIAW